MRPLVSVIIPTRDNVTTIDRCLASVRAQTWSALDIVVVNDGSIDGTEARCAAHAAADPRVRLYHTGRPQGAAVARNLAMRNARGDILAFIDGDIDADPDWLERLLAPLLADDADCTGGPDVVPASDPLVARCVGHSVDSPLATGGLRDARTRLVRYLPGTGNLALKRAVVERVGGFNELFHDSGEDKELLYRVRDAGFRIRYVPEARVWHHRTLSLRVHARKMYLSGVRRVDIWRGLHGTVEVAHVVPALLVMMVAALPPVLWGCPPAGRQAVAACAALVAIIVLADAAWAALRLRDLRALAVVPLSSLMVVLGYGTGTVVKCVQCALHGRVKRPSAGSRARSVGVVEASNAGTG